MKIHKTKNISNLGILTEREFEIFNRYEHGAFVRSEDRYIVDKYASIGEMGFGFGKENDRYQPTAILTYLGKDTLSRERIFRSPLKNFFYTLWALIE